MEDSQTELFDLLIARGKAKLLQDLIKAREVTTQIKRALDRMGEQDCEVELGFPTLSLAALAFCLANDEAQNRGMPYEAKNSPHKEVLIEMEFKNNSALLISHNGTEV